MLSAKVPAFSRLFFFSFETFLSVDRTGLDYCVSAREERHGPMLIGIGMFRDHSFTIKDFGWTQPSLANFCHRCCEIFWNWARSEVTPFVILFVQNHLSGCFCGLFGFKRFEFWAYALLRVLFSLRNFILLVHKIY